MQTNQRTGKEITEGSSWSTFYPNYQDRLAGMAKALRTGGTLEEYTKGLTLVPLVK